MSASQRQPNAEARVEDDLQYGHGPSTKDELEAKYPNRPHNHSKTLLFSELYLSLFDPLSANLKKPKTPRAKSKVPAHEQRRIIIDNFISRWRSEVGNDIYPAFRLIMPDKDRDRPVYGLKEAAIAKLLIKVLKIDPKSEDAIQMSQWKSIAGGNRNSTAGDFAGRCFEVLDKRNEMEGPGTMTIAEVNGILDKLTASQSDRDQLPIFEKFFNNMNSHELKWLIRIIVKQMKVGATEKTIFGSWHSNADALFNVSSSLRRVCWELTDPSLKLDDDHAGIELMSCYKPQLAQFQSSGLAKMIDRMGLKSDDEDGKDKGEQTRKAPFWIEEKLDGERMQMHMEEDDSVPGGFRFSFWSRKGKDYTSLYGYGFENDQEISALTIFIKNAFDPNLKNIILDGEMVEWEYIPDSKIDSMAEFGSLKTAALAQQKNSFAEGRRPLFRVFDCLLLNDTDLTRYELRERRKALQIFVKDVHRRIEIHPYTEAITVKDIEDSLREVINKNGEGLVLKNPRSDYRLNDRNDNWMKVKPEYMNEFGENLDCVVIGAYYGSGHRGGTLSSFLCGLRADKNDISRGADPEKFYSFFKVGGGFRREDYAHITHLTDGKWYDWDQKRPPTKYIELGGPDGRAEQPDQWIRPSESIVIEVKAASVGASEQFRTKFTLRFPRFKKVRTDKDWKQALSREEFRNLKEKAETEHKDNMTVDSKRKRITKRLKQQLVISGNDSKVKTPYAGPETAIFKGLRFCVLSDMLQPHKKSKAEIEQIIKLNGGSITQNSAMESTICIADKRVVKVASLVKKGSTNIIKPTWVLDAVKQSEIDGPGKEQFIIPYEPRHMFFTTPDAQSSIDGAVDMYGDSCARDTTVDELKHIFDDMVLIKDEGFSSIAFIKELEEHGKGMGEMQGSLFRGSVAFFGPTGDNSLGSDAELERMLAYDRYIFAGGSTTTNEDDESITHVVVLDGNPESIKDVRAGVLKTRRTRIPRMVRWSWIQDSWKEGTLLDEESYAPDV